MTEAQDTPVWKLDPTGTFTVKSDWNYITQREEKNFIFKNIWINGFPFKMDFLRWRIWKGQVPNDDNLRIWGIEGPTRC